VEHGQCALAGEDRAPSAVVRANGRRGHANRF
jgi:hypothetical protein